MVKQNELPAAAVSRIFKNIGAKRVSADATVQLREALETFGAQVAQAAWQIAKHSGRSTVMGKDVKLALK